MAIKVTRTSSASKSQLKRHSTTSLESPTTSESAKDTAKSRKAHAASARANKARASMACERCKHKKVKCEDYIEGQGCEKCRASNEICYFHRKEVEIKTSFRQGYVENCERECEHLKELVIRMYKEATEGQPLRTVEPVPKDGNPNITSLMHAYGVGLGEDFLGTFEAREAKLASEGHPMLAHNGKGDIQLSRDGHEEHLPHSPESMNHSSPHDTQPESTHTLQQETVGSPVDHSRSPSIGGYTTTNSQPLSRKSSTGSLFSAYSLPNQPQEETMTDAPAPSLPRNGPSRKQQATQSPLPSPATPTSQDQFQQYGNIDNWLSMKPNWNPAYNSMSSNNANPNGFQELTPNAFQTMLNQARRFSFSNNAANNQFMPARNNQSGFFQQDSMFQNNMMNLSSPDELQLPDASFFSDEFLQGADTGAIYDFPGTEFQ